MPARHVINRDGTWVYSRRVPKAYRAFDSRKIVTETTGLRVEDDPRANRAQRVAERINAAMVAYWEGAAGGAQQAAKARYDEACRKARAMGVTYLEASELAATLPTDQLLDRIERLERELAILRAPPMGDRPSATAEMTVAAMLGGVKRTTVPLSKLFDEFDKIRRVSLETKSRVQRMKWKNVRQRAAANFLAAVGDKDLAELTADDARAFRDVWEQRILSGEAKAVSANTDFAYLGAMIKELSLHHRWNLKPLFADLRFKKNRGEKNGQGVPFSTEWIREKLLAPDALAGLPPEARRAVCVIIETGLSPSEITNLDRKVIHLDAEIPYIRVTPGQREIKTENRERDMPLVGVALAAMRLQPDGFADYRDNPAALSGHVNRYFKQAGLREPRSDGKETTLYSLRHSFKDRLREARTGDELVDMLMGHSRSGERYGSGYTLERKKEALDRIAFVNYPTVL
jgi:integrase